MKPLSFSETEQVILFRIIDEVNSGAILSSLEKSKLLDCVAKEIENSNFGTLKNFLEDINKSPIKKWKFIKLIKFENQSSNSKWIDLELKDPERDRVMQALKDSSKPLSIGVVGVESIEELFSWLFYLHKQLGPEVYKNSVIFVREFSKGEFIIRKTDLSKIPTQFHEYIEYGSGPYSEYFKFAKEFFSNFRWEKIDSIVDRVKNSSDVLIAGNDFYRLFPSDEAKRKFHLDVSCPVIGSETNAKPPVSISGAKKVVLIVEDVAVARVQISAILKKNGFEVVAVGSAEEASVKIKQSKFDLITLDLGLPGESGADWLKRMRAQGLSVPVIIISSSEPSEAAGIFGALEGGAQHYFVKDEFVSLTDEFVRSVKALTTRTAATQTIKLRKQSGSFSFIPDLILIGASTGGPQALFELLRDFPQPAPPIIVVQHTSQFVIDSFATALARKAGLALGEMKNGETLKSSHIYSARGDYHLEVSDLGPSLSLRTNSDDRVLGHRPAVDPLFSSASKTKAKCLSILLTGMGRDGAEGMLELSKTPGNQNWAQSQESCVVYGMPKEAIARGAVDYVGSIADLRAKLELAIGVPSSKRKV